MIVADTNLIVHALLSEDRRAVAERVRRRDPVWVAPALWASEFRNVIVTHVRTGRLPAASAGLIWAAGRDLVGTQPIDGDRALDVAVDRGLTGYDAEFVLLAQSLGVSLVTSDKAVLRACPDLAVSPDAFLAAA